MVSDETRSNAEIARSILCEMIAELGPMAVSLALPYAHGRILAVGLKNRDSAGTMMDLYRKETLRQFEIACALMDGREAPHVH